MMDMSYSIRPADQEALKNSIFETFAINLGTSGLVADIREAIADANSILYICLLNGAVPFFVNATAHLPLGYCEYLRVSSYTGETQGEISMMPMSKETLSRKYDAVIMDPPSYGRGPGGEIWKLEDEVYGFVELCSELLYEDSLMMLINSYTTGLSSSVMEYILGAVIKKKFGGKVSSSEIGLPVTDSGMILPCGASAIWEKE